MNPGNALQCAKCGARFYVPARQWTRDEWKDISRVRTGFLLAAAGVVLVWFLDLGSVAPFLAVSMGSGLQVLAAAGWAVGAAGAVLLVGGTFLAFAGRRPFEYTYGGKAALALILLPLSLLFTFLALRFLMGNVDAFLAEADLLGVAWMFKSVLLWSFVLPMLAVLGVLLLAFDLQDGRGLRLAFIGVLVFAAAGLAGVLMGWLLIDLAPQSPVASTFYGAIAPALLPQRFIDIAWRLVFAVVLVKTYRRIARGEIPVPPEMGAPAYVSA